MMNELRPMHVILCEKCTPFYMKTLGRELLEKEIHGLVDIFIEKAW